MMLDSRKDIESAKSPRSVLHAELRLKHAPYPICRGGGGGGIKDVKQIHTRALAHTHTHSHKFFPLFQSVFISSPVIAIWLKKEVTNLEWE